LDYFSGKGFHRGYIDDLEIGFSDGIVGFVGIVKREWVGKLADEIENC
jgi:hypothetical protein